MAEPRTGTAIPPTCLNKSKQKFLLSVTTESSRKMVDGSYYSGHYHLLKRLCEKPSFLCTPNTVLEKDASFMTGQKKIT